jgi:uncharacterized DUF497 family protein
MDFRWNDWNVEHIARHGVSPEEAEGAVRGARSPFPRKIEEDKWLVWGKGKGGRYLQVVFVVDDPQESIYIIHARPLNEREKRQFRRKQK